MPDYFSHDYGARNDPKLVRLQMKMGQEGKGVFWDLIEMMYEQSGRLLLSEIDTYAFALQTQCDKINAVIHDFDLFKNDGIEFWNESCRKRLLIRNSKSDTARNSANKRWLYERNANALPTQCQRNAKAMLERKGKEIKEKKIKEGGVGGENFQEEVKIPDHLKDIWPAFLEVRKNKKAVNSPRALRMILTELNKLSQDPAIQIKIVEKSIRSSWSDVYQLKEGEIKQANYQSAREREEDALLEKRRKQVVL